MAEKLGRKVLSDAKQVFKGILFNIYQRQQEQFDGSFKIFELAERGDVVKSIPIIGDKILISRDEQPGVQGARDLFGGFVESGEDLLEAIKRETEEESGYQFEEYKEFRYSPYGMKVLGGKHYYLAKNCSGTIKQHLDAGGERIEVHQVGFDRFIEIVMSDDFCKPDFARYIAKNYIMTNRLDELKQLFFN